MARAQSALVIGLGAEARPSITQIEAEDCLLKREIGLALRIVAIKALEPGVMSAARPCSLKIYRHELVSRVQIAALGPPGEIALFL